MSAVAEVDLQVLLWLSARNDFWWISMIPDGISLA